MHPDHRASLDPDQYLSNTTWPDSGGVNARYGLFGTSCCRRIWSLLPEGSRQAVEIRERYDRGEVTTAECEAAIVLARRTRVEARRTAFRTSDVEFGPDAAAAWAAGAAYNVCVGNWPAGSELAAIAVRAIDNSEESYQWERRAQCELFAELNAAGRFAAKT